MKKSFVCVFALLLASAAMAQERPPSEVPPPAADEPEWEPLGPIPVDHAGAGRRGYAVVGEGAAVAAPGASTLSLHTVAANNFYREQTDRFVVSQRDETHTFAVEYRRGFAWGRLRRIELGGQLQLHQRDGGFLNGFIAAFEDLWVAMTGSESAKNQLRGGAAPALPPGTLVTRDGLVLYRAPGNDTAVGDVRLVVKALLRDGAFSTGGARVAARFVVNASRSSSFTEGDFTGFGISVQQPLTRWAAFHGDARATVLLDRTSDWNLPLQRMTFGFSAGPELKLTANSSLNLQFDGNTTPYQPTGSTAFDKAYGALTLGVSHRMRAKQTPLLLQAYVRENLNLPFRVRWNTDPDLAVGIKLTMSR